MYAERAPRFNIEAIKQTIDLAEFAQRYTTLLRISRQGEHAGPCPRCGGEDRFHVKGTRFYCRQCNPRGGDIIDLLRWLHGLTFVEACLKLQSDALFSPDRPAPAPLRPTKIDDGLTPLLPEYEFQQSAWRTIKATQRRLMDEPDGAGSQYLRGRGFTETTWQSYLVGYGQAFHPRTYQNMSAIFIPWLDQNGRKVLAIQHRFTAPTLGHNGRYTMKAGSAPTLFGLHLLQPAQQLIIVEGEFNCMAIHQCGFTALSIGSETNVRKPGVLTQLRALCAMYTTITIWLDNPQRGQQLIADLTTSGVLNNHASRLVEYAQDANLLLVNGQLDNFLQEVLNAPM